MSRLAPYEHEKGARDRRGRFEPFNVPRPLMPQIDDVAGFVGWIEAHGVAVTYEDERPDRLRPHQSVQWNHKADKLSLEACARCMSRPVIASWDRYIIDGHHSWDAHKASGTLVPTLVVHAKWNRAIELTSAWPGVRHVEVEDVS